MQTGANISQVFLSASEFFDFPESSSSMFEHHIPSFDTKIVTRKHALTNFFDLSNIRFVSWGSGEMFGASRCFRTALFQSDGPPALAAVKPFCCNLSVHSTNFRSKRCDLRVFVGKCKPLGHISYTVFQSYGLKA
jgi:hypothetical protein